MIGELLTRQQAKIKPKGLSHANSRNFCGRCCCGHSCWLRCGNDRLRNLNSQQIAEQIVDTQTNRQDVVALLGEPNTTQQEADGTKVLEYTWVRSRPSAKNFIPLNPIDEFPTTKKSLRVWIDDNDRVVKHEYSGVFYVYRKPLIGSNSTHSMRPLTQEELDGLADPTEEAAADKE